MWSGRVRRMLPWLHYRYGREHRCERGMSIESIVPKKKPMASCVWIATMVYRDG